MLRLRWNVGQARVYTLTVATDHTFFVGTARVLVHNQLVDCGKVYGGFIYDASGKAVESLGSVAVDPLNNATRLSRKDISFYETITGQPEATVLGDANREALAAELAAHEPGVQRVFLGRFANALIYASPEQRQELITLAQVANAGIPAESAQAAGQLTKKLNALVGSTSGSGRSVDAVAVTADGRYFLYEAKGATHVGDALDQMRQSAAQLGEGNVLGYTVVVPETGHNLPTLGDVYYRIENGTISEYDTATTSVPTYLQGRRGSVPVNIVFARQ